MDAAGGLAAALGACKGIKILEVGLCAGGRISINLYVLAFRLGKRSARVAPRSSKEGGQGRSSRLSRISPNSFFLFTNLPYVKTKGCQTAHLPHSQKARNTNVTWQGWFRPFLLKPAGASASSLEDDVVATMPAIPLRQYPAAYKTILNAARAGPNIGSATTFILVALDVDALAAARLLHELLTADYVNNTIIPIRNWKDLDDLEDRLGAEEVSAYTAGEESGRGPFRRACFPGTRVFPGTRLTRKGGKGRGSVGEVKGASGPPITRAEILPPPALPRRGSGRWVQARGGRGNPNRLDGIRLAGLDEPPPCRTKGPRRRVPSAASILDDRRSTTPLTTPLSNPQVRNLILINLGASEDLAAGLSFLPRTALIHVIDSHRPINLANLFRPHPRASALLRAAETGKGRDRALDDLPEPDEVGVIVWSDDEGEDTRDDLRATFEALQVRLFTSGRRSGLGVES